MAQTNLDPGGFDQEEARRRAILNRINSLGDGGPRLTEGSPGDFPSSRPTVAAQAGPRDAHDRRSVLEQNEQAQAGPFAGRTPTPSTTQQDYMREELERTAASNARQQQRAGERTAPSSQLTESEQNMARREVAGQAARNAASGVAGAVGGAADHLRKTFFPSAEEIRSGGIGGSVQRGLEQGSFLLPVGQIAGKIAKPVVESPLGRAIADRLSGGVSGALRNATQIGDDAAARVGRTFGPTGPNSFRLIGQPIDEAVESGAIRAARARSTNAGVREAAGQPAPYSTAPTPLTTAITNRIASIPVARAVNPATAIAGTAAGLAGLAALPGSEAVTPEGEQGGPEGQQPQVAPPQTATTLVPPAPSAQTTQGTPVPGATTAPGTVIRTPGAATPPPAATTPGAIAPNVPTVSPFGPQTGVVGPQGPSGTVPIGTPPGGRPRAGATPGQTPLGPTTGPVSEVPGTSEGLRQQVIADLNGIAQIINAGPQSPDVMALFLSQGSKLIDLINEQEKTLRAQAESEGRAVDPATQNVIDTLRESLGRELKATKERLNARGLLDSGILVEAEQMLVKGNLSDQAKILAERLSRIQNNLNTGLSQLRGQRVDAAGRFGMAGAEAQTQAEMAERKRLDDLRDTLVRGRLGLGEQYGREEQAQISRDFEAEQNELDRGAAFARAQADLAARAQDREAERMWREKEAELNRENQRLIAEMNNAARGQSPTSTGVDLATNNVIAQIRSAGSRDAAMAAVQAAQGQPGFENVNWNAVLDAINTTYPASGGFKFPWDN